MRLLEDHSGTCREAVAGEHYMSRDFDPHPLLEAVLGAKSMPGAGA